MGSKRQWIIAAGLIGAFVLQFFIAGVILHETGHAFAAMLLGVPFNELKFGWFGIGPGVTVPSYVTHEFLVVFRYAGGLISGAVFLIVYTIYVILHRHAYSRSNWWVNDRWWFGYILLLTSMFNLFTAYYEGGRYEEYLKGYTAQISFSGALFSAFIVNAVMAFIIHKTIYRKRKTSPEYVPNK
jgi:hypothetical protein